MKFENKRLDYWGGQQSYIEAIEVENPPENKSAIVLVLYSNSQYTFWEIESEDKAIKAADTLASELSMSISGLDRFRKRNLFIREVNCKDHIPWFLAKNNQTLDGDFVAL